jgi:cell wall-associated NlpC family hydrolase
MDNTIQKLIGIDYDYGGTSTSGFDCSGFTGYVFKKLGLDLPRSSRDQFVIGKKVAREDLRAGDLVFFNTNGKSVSHVGIYVGNNKFAHSSTSKGVTITCLSDSYYVDRYLGARRVMDSDTYQELATEPQTVAAVPEVAAEKVELTAAAPVDATASE